MLLCLLPAGPVALGSSPDSPSPFPTLSLSRPPLTSRSPRPPAVLSLRLPPSCSTEGCGSSLMTPDVARRAPLTAAEEQPSFQVGVCWSREAHLASGGAHPTSPGRGRSSAKPREVTESLGRCGHGAPDAALGQLCHLPAKARGLGPALQRADLTAWRLAFSLSPTS